MRLCSAGFSLGNSTNMTTSIGIDIGGTKISIGVLDDQSFTSKKVIATPKDGWRSVLNRVIEEVQAVEEGQPRAQQVGIGMPGMFNPERTEVVYASNVYGFQNVPLVEYVSEALGRVVVLENDANAAALAEDTFGAAKNASSSVFLTISTGIGSSIILNGRIWRGVHGIAGEIGHIVADPEGALAPSGVAGALEGIASGTAIARDASYALGHPVSTSEAFALAQEGNELMERVVHRAMRYLGMALANVQKLIDPEVFVIGGGVASSGPYFLEHVHAYAQQFARGFCDIKVVPAQFGTDAGALGAAIAAQQSQSH